TRPAHPLAPLSAAEIKTAAAVIRDTGRLPDDARFAYFGLDEPPKEAVSGFAAGDPVERRVRVVLVPGPVADVVEAVVDVGRRAVTSWRDVPGMRPALLFEEARNAILALNESAEWRAGPAPPGGTPAGQASDEPRPPP